MRRREGDVEAVRDMHITPYFSLASSETAENEIKRIYP